MGTLYYGNARTAVEIDDRSLAHLRFVMLAKLRRNEGFGFTWTPASGSATASTIWVAPSIPLQFDFDDDTPVLNREWLEVLTQVAATSGGLTLVEEPSVAGSDAP